MATPESNLWLQFPAEAGSLNMPRARMPQIKSVHRGAMVQYLKGRGITHSQEDVLPSSLKPSQAEFSPEKVDNARNFEGQQRRILVSSDDHVLDGHHQWLSALDTPDKSISAIRFNAPIHQLLVEAARFPSSGLDESSVAASDETQEEENRVPQPVLDETEFAARIKARHPEYAGMEDADLTRRVIEKYPEYQSSVRRSSPAPVAATANGGQGFWDTATDGQHGQMDERAFAGRIRAKHPGAYDSLDDGELSRRVLNKYPEYRPHVRLSDSALRPTVTSSVVEDFDSSQEPAAGVEGFKPIEFQPFDESDLSTLQRGAVAAAQVGGVNTAPRPSISNRLQGKPVTITVAREDGRLPDADALSDAMLEAMGALDVGRRFRAEVGRPIATPEQSEEELMRGYDPETKTFSFAVHPSRADIRLINAYAQGGLSAAQAESEKIREEDDAEHAQAVRQRDAVRQAVRDMGFDPDDLSTGNPVMKGIADAGLGSVRLLNNVSAFWRDPADAARDAESIEAAQQSIPEEKTSIGRMTRGLTGGVASLPQTLVAGPTPMGMALSGYAQNIHRGQEKALEEGLKIGVAGGVGQGVGRALEVASPVARQVVARGAAGSTNTGLAYAAGERDPQKLAESFGVGAAMPVGKSPRISLRVGDLVRGTRSRRLPDGTLLSLLDDGAGGTVRVQVRPDDSPVAVDPQHRQSAPETPYSLKRQLAALKQGRRGAVLVTPGEQIPVMPKGHTATSTEKGIFVHDPRKVSPTEIRQRAADGTYNELLGYVDAEGANTVLAVTARDKRGREIISAYASPENAGAQARELKRQFPDAEIEIGGNSQESGVVRSRAASEQKIYEHETLGRLTPVEDQSGVGRDFIRVQTDAGEVGVVRLPNAQGIGGVREVGKDLPASFRGQGEPTSPLDTAVAAYRVGLLGVKTHIRNVVSTGSNQLLDEVSRLPASIVDLATSAVTGRRSVSGPDIGAVARSSYEAATKGVKEAKDILLRGAKPEELARYEQNREVNSGSKIIDAYTNGHFRLLAAEDQLFRSYAMRRSLEDQARVQVLNEVKAGELPRNQARARAADLVDNPSAEMQAQAVTDAEVATFNNPNILHRGYMAARDVIATALGGKAVNAGLDVLLPFTRTPTNIIARTLEYTPVGAGKAAARLARDVAKKNFTIEQQKEFSRAMGRSVTGTALILLGYTLAANGDLTGAPGDDPRFSATDNNAPPYSIKVNGEWHKIAGFSPLGDLITIGATIHQGHILGDDTLTSSVKALGGVTAQQPMLRTTSDLVEAASSPGKKGQKFAGRVVGGFVPTVVSDFASAIDDKERARGNDFTNQIAIRVPGWREGLPEAKDQQGRPMEHRSTDFFDPTLTRSVKDDTPEGRTFKRVTDELRAAPAFEKLPPELRGRVLRSASSSAGEDVAAGLPEDAVLHNSRVAAQVAYLRSIIDEADVTPVQRERLNHVLNSRFFYARVRAGDDRALESVQRVFRERTQGAEDFIRQKIGELKK